RPDTEGGVGGEQADRRRRQPHDQKRQVQHRLAAELVAVMAEDDAADRPRDEPHRVGRERGDGAGEGRKRRKKQLVEDERGGGTVEEEVVPLDGRPDEAGGGDLQNSRTAFQVAVARGDGGGHHASMKGRGRATRARTDHGTPASRWQLSRLARSSAANPVEPLTSSKRCSGRERRRPPVGGKYDR